ncbi:MAG: hypothetical protein H6555_07400 [Lewinellaceae bacterium]|nr:hypothetical protein [Lewinellaceae bacterium]
MQINQIRDIIKTDLALAISHILSSFPLQPSEKDEVHLFEIQLEELQKEARLNIISYEEKNRRIDKIRFAILEFVTLYERRFIKNDTLLAIPINQKKSISNHPPHIKKTDDLLNRILSNFNLESKWRSDHDGEGNVNYKFKQDRFRILKTIDEIVIAYDISSITEFYYDTLDPDYELFGCKKFENTTHQMIEIRFKSDSIKNITIKKQNTYSNYSDKFFSILKFTAKEIGAFIEKKYHINDRLIYRDTQGKITNIEYQDEEGQTTLNYLDEFEIWINEKNSIKVKNTLKEIIEKHNH